MYVLYEDPSKAFNLTFKCNTISVVSDGTAVLGLGDIGPLAALPVMEGKAVVMNAGLISALKLTGRSVSDIKVVVAGVGAAGVKEIIGFDRCGILSKDRHWYRYSSITTRCSRIKCFRPQSSQVSPDGRDFSFN